MASNPAWVLGKPLVLSQPSTSWVALWEKTNLRTAAQPTGRNLHACGIRSSLTKYDLVGLKNTPSREPK